MTHSLRADARRNRELILEAAKASILERGADVPLEVIARRAEVGIATLYRRFPAREDLMNALARHVLDQSMEAAETALSEEEDAFAALRRYMHAALDLRIGVLNLIYPMITDSGWGEARTKSALQLESILKQALRDGSLRKGIRVPDLGVAIVRFSRPVTPGRATTDDLALAHRHLAIYVDGLRAGAYLSALETPQAALDAFDPTTDIDSVESNT